MALAIKHVNRKLKLKCVWNWIQFVGLEKKLKREEESMLRSAVYQHRIKFLKKFVRAWRAQTAHSKGIKTMARVLIKHVKNEILVKRLFREWWSIVVEAKRTREYFERLEMGTLRSDSTGQTHGEYTGSRQEIMAEAARRTIESELRDHLASLPQDLQIMLFSYLNPQDLARCSMVCRSWRAFVCDLSELPVLDCSQIPHLVTNEALKILTGHRQTFLRSIDLRGTYHLSGFNTVAICKNLQELSLAFSLSLVDEDLRNISFQCVNLLKLDISGTRITDIGLRHLATSATNLQILNLSKCGRITDKCGDLFLPDHVFPNLLHLNVGACSQLQPTSLINMCHGNRIRHWFLNRLNDCVTDEALVNMSRAGIQTLELRVSNEHLKPAQNPPKTLPVKAPTKRAHTTHQMGRCSKVQRVVTDKSLTQLLGPKMERLVISGLKQITENAFSGMSAADGGSLRHFECSHCPKVGDSVTRFLSGHRHLVYLKLSFCDRVNDTTIKIIGDSLYAQTLRELYIDHCSKITDLSLLIIGRRLGKLAHLSLAGCVRVTDQAFDHLANLTQLASLNVCKSNFSDSAIANLAAGCLKLKTLLARSCPGVTDIGLQKFAHLAKHIECLDLSFCRTLTDSSMKTLAFCCRFLRKLSLAGCKELSIKMESGSRAITNLMKKPIHILSRLPVGKKRQFLISILDGLEQQLEESFQTALAIRHIVAKERKLKRSFRLKFLLAFMDHARERNCDVGGLISTMLLTAPLLSSRSDLPMDRFVQNVYFVMNRTEDASLLRFIDRFIAEILVPMQITYRRLQAPILIEFCVKCLSKCPGNEQLLQLLHETLVFEGGIYYEFPDGLITQPRDTILAHQHYLTLANNGMQTERAILIQLCLFEKLDCELSLHLLGAFEPIFLRHFRHDHIANLIKFFSISEAGKSPLFEFTFFYLQRVFNARAKLQILKYCRSPLFWSKLTDESDMIMNVLESFPQDGNLYRFPAFGLSLYKVLSLCSSKPDCQAHRKSLCDFNHFLSIYDHGISLPSVNPLTMALPQ
ncbi:Dynein regulatory complex subunit 6 [Cichlidogyrus casuarinus]|uniref:Dynein regulatory complex subunit 6 n=1 Tax=Cichlidogyrus casuarinus TaxID=1844966 RepID=A0ABD2QJD2_9PLAT